MTTRDVVFPAGRQALYEKNRYSPAVRSGRNLAVALAGPILVRKPG